MNRTTFLPRDDTPMPDAVRERSYVIAPGESYRWDPRQDGFDLRLTRWAGGWMTAEVAPG